LVNSLKILDLSLNELEQFDNNFFLDITGLDLSFNPIKKLNFSRSRLKSLKLSNINSTVLSSIDFHIFTQLEELDLSDNLDIDTEQLKGLIKLKKLNLKKRNINKYSVVLHLLLSFWGSHLIR
jgi:hypothetical protein